eukprot:CAMPEP_0183339392 /NCGR_PEP_ID=MMETSP0164_2-20130417/6333_1 /TAXON_ID=221442 /ORGANISM="Coccolithus pelagicus ssp braarudi, Strain PLY182g" /LENGTH=48 /DNA_ID= /DNA_START= /DNA_END= /DNA_ORIENTATION=
MCSEACRPPSKALSSIRHEHNSNRRLVPRRQRPATEARPMLALVLAQA